MASRGVRHNVVRLRSLTRLVLLPLAITQTEPEPLPDGHVLFDLPNVILTPHCSWASEINFHRATDLLEQNVAKFAAGEGVLNVLRSKGQ